MARKINFGNFPALRDGSPQICTGSDGGRITGSRIGKHGIHGAVDNVAGGGLFGHGRI